MEFVAVRSPSLIQIRSYADGILSINQENYSHSVIALPDQLILDWPVKDITQFTVETCALLIQLKPEILLIGTGANLILPHQDIFGYLNTQGFGVEFMRTTAACHTFQILTAEKRKVVAALMV